MKTEFILNGEARIFDFEPTETLLDAMRTKAGLTSVKCGCERGDCGTCTLLVNGQATKSCLVLAVEMAGQEVTTLEGLMHKGDLTPLQKAFLDQNAFQCGFCAPGMIMAATDLLAQNPHPDRAAIQEHLSGNLCRCTGYSPIIDTVLQVVEAADAQKSVKVKGKKR